MNKHHFYIIPLKKDDHIKYLFRVQLASSGDPLASCSDHHSCIPKEGGHKMTGPLSALQLKKQRASQQAGQLFRTGHVAQQASTMTHLENQVAAALALKSSQEYKFWLLTYMRYLVQEGVEAKIREVCDELLGPVYKSKTASSWESHTLGLGKRHLLQEILPIVGSNLRFQRLFTEYKEQLDTAKL
ncbi:protein HIRA-like [Lingula anatina]|uniref:Protein HIRA-like n=1 Tax=Lingula anatina TaxID=7574 RepID=A0A1S3K2N9_LINAN|nr:protein HIRA-like [Lingula anatina]|eukprot:XP_013416664.1 protein HIRA-like [Lingula anatina]